MGAMKWSPEQELAINEDGKNIIVSAGAGSGKTAVLTARVIRKLKSGVHINELLVLTFTNAAAAEMKDRIRSSINSTPGLEEEANLIDGAYITTFDSFSLSVVKKYHTRLNITNKIAICDQVVIDLARDKILDEIMDEYYLSNNSKFNKLINDFCLKNDDELKGYIKNIYSKIELKYDKEKFLEEFFGKYYTDECYIAYVDEYTEMILNKVRDISKLLISLNDYFDGDFVGKMEDCLSKLINARSYEDVLSGIEIGRMPSAPKGSPEEGKIIKSSIGDIVKEIKELCIYSNTSEMIDEIKSTKDNAEVVIELVKELDKRLSNYKMKNELFNFTDIARLAIKVVKENDDIRDELSKSFNEILVDEYQDTSDTQETFIGLIAHNNVYMVGDIKQSIYRFRNANPYIFKDKYDTYRDDPKKGMKIDLLKNFRSRREVLDNINLLFDLFMDDYIGGADYKVSHRMVFGNTSYEEEGLTDQKYDFEVYKYNKSTVQGITKDEQEAFIIGEDILDKVNNHYQVFDKGKKILRDVTFNDFVILLDKSKNFELYKKIFEYLGIPLSILKEQSLKKDYDVLVLKNLLKLLICIKNKDFSNDFKYCFVSVARSFLYRLDDDLIFSYFVNNNFFNSDIYKELSELVKNMDIMSPKEFFNFVVESVKYEEKLITIGDIKAFRIRLEYFYNLISNFESQGNTIYDFVLYLDSIFEGESDLKFNINSSSGDSCKIMTIHKSKGLEYHICYFAGFTGKFNLLELKEKILFDNKYGLVISSCDEYYKDTIIKKLLKNRTKLEEISEKIRLLYVAVTRAKEKMIFVMPNYEEESLFIEDIVPNYVRSKYSSFYDIMLSIYSNIEMYTSVYDLIVSKAYLDNSSGNKNVSTSDKILEVKKVEIENTYVEEAHYSKDSLHIITKEEVELMEFGTKVHEVLEQMNFKDNNLDKFNVSDRIKDKINTFLNSDLMKDKLDYEMYKEYEFLFEEDNKISHGIIDLLIDCGDYLMIVDYKLKNIDDINYDKQLNGYREFLEKKTGKRVECYLYSIIDSIYRMVK